MENIGNFLESSTIHGLSYISTTKKYVRVFWFLVVISGFTGAGVLIYESFQSWDESPVKTTIETHPITDLTLPKVTVCPPKNTYTDLNYDLMMTANMTLDDNTRDELLNYAKGLLNDETKDQRLTEYFNALFHRNNSASQIILSLNSFLKNGKHNNIIANKLFQRITEVFSLKYPEIQNLTRGIGYIDSLEQNNLKGNVRYDVYLRIIM